MDKMIGFCGLTCTECPAFLATRKNDDNKRRKVSELWSKKFNIKIKPEEVNCEGCVSGSARLIEHCNVCEIRKCGQERHVSNCAYCGDYACEKLNKFLNMAPAARLTLEQIRTGVASHIK